MRARDEIALLVRNPVTYAGALLAAGSFVVIVFLLIIEVVGGRVTPYLGVVAYVALPALFVVGLLLIPIGMSWTRWRMPSTAALEVGIQAFPSLDLNDPVQRKGLLLWGATTVVFVGVLAGVSYRAYHFTDSVEFCGLLCHTVMQPEYVTYQHSPHARVSCTACHIGPGADWFVRAKVSGMRQVLAVATNTFPRPIPVPIRDLRPARETCETCHWPEKFYGDQLRTWTAYQPDEKNTPQKMSMVIKTGGGGAEFGDPNGSHWHVSEHNRVTYVATDRERQQIVWMKLERPSGQPIEYTRTDFAVTPEFLAAAEKREMDCMDCHNRPTHHFRTPNQLLDAALSSGRIDASLPFVKKMGVDLLSRSYPDEPTALRTIETEVAEFYKAKYPELYTSKQPYIQVAIYEIKRAYWENNFPTMKVDYRTYGDNIGHTAAPGCFRCHDGKHASKDGKTIRRECTLCHTPPAVVK